MPNQHVFFFLFLMYFVVAKTVGFRITLNAPPPSRFGVVVIFQNKFRDDIFDLNWPDERMPSEGPPNRYLGVPKTYLPKKCT